MNRPAKCILRRGSCFLPTGTPGGGVQIPEYSASRSPQVRERECKTALKAPILSPNAPRAARFYRMRPMVPAFRPKSSMQAPSAAEYSQKCTPHPTPGTRSKKTNSLGLPSYRRRPQGLPPPKKIFPQDGRTPPREARSGVLTCPRTIWEVSPGASDGGGSSRGYSSPKLMPNALASRTRSLWGSTYLSLPATSSSGMWHILPSRRAIM